jgi:uncharacterized protein YkwD
MPPSATVAKLLSLALLGGVSAGCGGGKIEGTSGSASDLQFCVEETNRYRAMDGRPPIAWSAALEQYATVGAESDTQTMSAHGHFGQTQGGGVASAENACPSWLGWSLGSGENAVHDAIAGCIKAFYDEGEGGGHYENLMGDLPKLGCGVFVIGDGSEGSGITIIQDFGD